MLSKCLNPACSTPFRYFRDGRIFNIETTSPSKTDGSVRRREFFWLCGACSTAMVTVRDGTPTVEQRSPQLLSRELIEQAEAKSPYLPDQI